MSKRPHTSNTRLNPDPAAGNIRDPEQKNDELERHDTPAYEDPSQRLAAKPSARPGPKH
jgi:hypothetical protein